MNLTKLFEKNFVIQLLMRKNIQGVGLVNHLKLPVTLELYVIFVKLYNILVSKKIGLFISIYIKIHVVTIFVDHLNCIDILVII